MLRRVLAGAAVRGIPGGLWFRVRVVAGDVIPVPVVVRVPAPVLAPVFAPVFAPVLAPILTPIMIRHRNQPGKLPPPKQSAAVRGRDCVQRDRRYWPASRSFPQTGGTREHPMPAPAPVFGGRNDHFLPDRPEGEIISHFAGKFAPTQVCGPHRCAMAGEMRKLTGSIRCSGGQVDMPFRADNLAGAAGRAFGILCLHSVKIPADPTSTSATSGRVRAARTIRERGRSRASATGRNGSGNLSKPAISDASVRALSQKIRVSRVDNRRDSCSNCIRMRHS